MTNNSLENYSEVINSQYVEDTMACKHKKYKFLKRTTIYHRLKPKNQNSQH